MKRIPNIVTAMLLLAIAAGPITPGWAQPSVARPELSSSVTTPLPDQQAPEAFASGQCEIGGATPAETDGTVRAKPPVPGKTLDAPPSWPPLRAPDMTWVNDTLASMTLDQKIGQMIWASYSSSTALTYISTYHVGGFVFLGNGQSALTILNAVNALQTASPTPLLFSLDCEPGAGGRTAEGTHFPMNMGLGATRDTAAAYEQGRITARECRSMGIQVGFGPVLDVNTTGINPVIGVRAYSDDPNLVTQLARAHVQGANSEGLLCCFKHYPGHGAANGDSHNLLPTIDIPIDELENVHVAPYRTLIGEGFDNLVMSAHVWYPCLDPGPDPWPATLSTPALTDILRTDLDYTGTVISDSFGMAGLQNAAPTYDAVRIGVLAGLDIILNPPAADMDDAFNGLKDAVNGGAISVARIDDSVRRILCLKSRVGIPEVTTVSATLMQQTVGHADHLAVAESVARRTICTARLQSGDVPLTTSQSIYCLTFNTANTIFYRDSASYFTNAMAARFTAMTVQAVSTTVNAGTRAAYVTASASYDRVVVAGYDWKPTQPTAQTQLVLDLLAAGRTVIYVSFGSPWHYLQFPDVENYYCAFCSHYESQEIMPDILLGLQPAQGTWPIDDSWVPVSLSNWLLE